MRGKTILVIDDSRTVRDLLQMNLRRLGDVRLVEAADGVEGLEKCRAEAPSLVLTDVNMPRLDGFGVVEGIRVGMNDAKTPIVIVTTQGDQRSVERGLALGATAYLTKPIHGARLVDLARSLLLG